MKIEGKIRLIVALVLAAVLMLTVTVAVLAANEEPKEDATVAIEAAFSDKRIGETVKVANDGYIGIPVEVTNYYDFAAHGKAKSGYNGTVLVIYVVNTNTERVGSKSDTEIIQSMLDRGYIVSVLDYLNNSAAKSPALDWSTQTIRKEFLAGAYFSDRNVFPSGKYNDNFIVPAGYDLTYGQVFWEADKHGADGTLEKIVENWNTDVKGTKAERLVKWATGETADTRKKVAVATDGSAPVWYNASGAVDTSGVYTKVKYTVAEKVTDCVKPDGSPLDLKLYMHIVYHIPAHRLREDYHELAQVSPPPFPRWHCDAHGGLGSQHERLLPWASAGSGYRGHTVCYWVPDHWLAHGYRYWFVYRCAESRALYASIGYSALHLARTDSVGRDGSSSVGRDALYSRGVYCGAEHTGYGAGA